MNRWKKRWGKGLKEQLKIVAKGFVTAFSTYSRIPMPVISWEQENLRYALCFFPWVGAVVGVGIWCFWVAARKLELGVVCTSLMGAAIPLFITGGFHLDGFMDAMDAFCSCGERERKLEILKDAHIGAFSVIMTLLCGMVYVSAFSEIRGREDMAVFGCGFVLARTLSGLSLLYLPGVGKNGLLAAFAGAADKSLVRAVLWGYLALCVGVMFYIKPVTGGLVLAAAAGSFWYYRRRSLRELGGITGDMAGYFVVLCETAMAVAAAVGSRL